MAKQKAKKTDVPDTPSKPDNGASKPLWNDKRKDYDYLPGVKKYKVAVKSSKGDYEFTVNALNVQHVHEQFDKFGKGGRVTSIVEMEDSGK